MRIICALSPWITPDEANAPKRRGRKATSRQRWVCILDANNWTLAIERENAPPIGKKFAGNLKDFSCNIKATCGLEAASVMRSIANALGITIPKDIDSAESIGAYMDKHYNVPEEAQEES